MARRTTCTKGLHDLTDPANVVTKADGSRQCRPCLSAARRESDRRAYAGEPPLYPQLPKGQTTCAVEGCDRPRAWRGKGRHCSAHAQRLRRWADAYEDVPVGYKRWQALPDSRAELA